MSGMIGAGFITGREIYSYFIRFGIKGLAGILLAGLLFALLGVRIAEAVEKDNCSDMRELSCAVLGEKAGRVVCFSETLFLYCMYIVMTAGASELLCTITGWHKVITTIIVSVLSTVLLLCGFDKIAGLSAAAAPVTGAIMLAVSAASGNFRNAFFGETMSAAEVSAESTPAFLWVAAAIVYCGYNLLILLSVMPRVTCDNCDISTARAGSALGALFVTLLLLAVGAGLLGMPEAALRNDMPLLHAAEGQSVALKGLMIGSVLVTMVLSCACNLSNCGRELAKQLRTSESAAGLLLVLPAALLSFAGFGILMDIFYTFFGILGVLLIIPLVFKRK